jgi:hypothetical protein
MHAKILFAAKNVIKNIKKLIKKEKNAALNVSHHKSSKS